MERSRAADAGTSGRRAAAHGGQRTCKNEAEAEERESLYERLAWPVAERMLQIVASNKTAPREFKPADFVQRSFEDTFATRANSSAGASGFASGRPGSGCSVVDAALGAMGFNATTICERKMDLLVNTFTSSAKSKASHGSSYLLTSTHSPDNFGHLRRPLRRDDLLQDNLCEQGISPSGLHRMVERCIPFLVSGNASGTQVRKIVDSLLNVGVNSSLFTPCTDAAYPALHRKLICGRGSRKCSASALQSFIKYVVDEEDGIYSKLHPRSRLSLWRLQPSSLKQDLSRLAQRAVDRQLLSLARELRESEEWTVMVAALTLAPDVFAEARRLLHTWFMASGAIRIWEVRAEMVQAVWSVLDGPAAWGFKEEVHLPPQHAYYHASLRPFVSLLRWPPTLTGLAKLMQILEDHVNKVNSAALGRASALDLDVKNEKSGLSINSDGKNIPCDSDFVDHNSLWALLMEFPPWLHFAATALFQRQGSSPDQRNASSSCPIKASETPSTSEDFQKLPSNGGSTPLWGNPRHIAARYIAWMMNPVHSRSRSSDEQMLLEVSQSWENLMKTVCGNSDSPPGSSEPRAEDQQPEEQQHSGQSKQSKCSVCQAPTRNSKRQKCGEMGAAFTKGSREPSEGRIALDLWLANLMLKLDGNEHKESLSRANGRKEERTPVHASPYIDQCRKWVMIRVLPLRALAGSRLRLDSPRLVARVLQFVCFQGSQPWTHESSAYEWRCSVAHCQDCCPKRSVKRLSSNSSTGVQGREQSHVEGDQSLLDPRDGKLPHWVPGAATLFNFLDSIQQKQQQEDDSCEYFRPATLRFGTESAAARNQDLENLAIVVSELVMSLGNTFEVQSSPGVFSKGGVKECHVTTLEDLRSRFCAWVEDLQISSEGSRICDATNRALDIRIANLRSLLISS